MAVTMKNADIRRYKNPVSISQERNYVILHIYRREKLNSINFLGSVAKT
jgi:hypothetical protein